MQAIDIEGAILGYRHRPGLVQTIVFANSLGSDQSIWDDVISNLPTGYGVLTYDLRGHGLSSGVALSIEQLAQDVITLIEALELTDVIFCGVSVGGMIGQYIASQRPDLIKAAVLCNTATRLGSSQRWTERITAVEQNGVVSIAKNIVRGWFGPDYLAKSSHLQLHENMVSRTSDQGYLAACKVLRDANLENEAKDIALPTLCIAGSHDQSVPAADVARLAKSVKGARLETLENVGHLPCLEVPQTLASLIVEFNQKTTKNSDLGMAVRRKILGGSHVDQAIKNTTALDAAFQDLITKSAWGSVWASPGIGMRERSMLTLALLAATGNFDEIAMHIRATMRTGATQTDICEAFQHVAIYAGVPRANQALKIAKATFAEIEGLDN